MCSVLFGVASCSFISKNDANPERNKLLIDLISFVLDREHFDAREINDNFSKEVYKSYVEALDPQKRYFYQSHLRRIEGTHSRIARVVSRTLRSSF